MFRCPMHNSWCTGMGPRASFIPKSYNQPKDADSHPRPNATTSGRVHDIHLYEMGMVCDHHVREHRAYCPTKMLWNMKKSISLPLLTHLCSFTSASGTRDRFTVGRPLQLASNFAHYIPDYSAFVYTLMAIIWLKAKILRNSRIGIEWSWHTLLIYREKVTKTTCITSIQVILLLALLDKEKWNGKDYLPGKREKLWNYRHGRAAFHQPAMKAECIPTRTSTLGPLRAPRRGHGLRCQALTSVRN